MKKMNIAGIATAAMIGFTAISGAQAAPFTAAAQAETAISGAGLVQVADRGDRGGGGQRGERNRGRHNGNGHHNNNNKHHGNKHHGRGHGFHGYVDYGRNCFWKQIRVFDPFLGGFVYEKQFVCSRYY